MDIHVNVYISSGLNSADSERHWTRVEGRHRRRTDHATSLQARTTSGPRSITPRRKPCFHPTTQPVMTGDTWIVPSGRLFNP